ncbi:MAG: hypothetical protein JSV86_02950 [Gemmatimonadota bacterium]|nr:MAG: hypothetical protein JSV86_02950 [Gemmatimonadota bacterium]
MRWISIVAATFAAALAGLHDSGTAAGAGRLAPSDATRQSIQARRFPLGEVVERVVASSDSTQSYALYLPSSYRADTGWPVLFVMDPGGRAVMALNLFRRGAERYGYIVLSSYGTRSDVTDDPNTPALQAMLTDAQLFFTIDSRRIYLAGFSGTARVGWIFADRLRGYVSGLIGFGGGQPGGALLTVLSPEETFAFFGGAGTTDFNYEEMRQLDSWLDRIGLPHRFEYFDGGHSWAPEEFCFRSLEWMELQTMKMGRRPRDDAWMQAQLEERLEVARALEAAGELYEAFIRYQAISEDFGGLLDVGDVAVKAAELERDRNVRRTVERMDDLAEWQRRQDDRFYEFLEDFRTTDRLPSLERSLRRLNIEDLQRRAAETERPLDAQAAQRLLEHIFVRVAYYEPEDFLREGEAERALGMVMIADVIRPESPRVYLNLARAHAQLGQVEQALQALERVVAAGAVNAAFLEGDAYLEPLRGEPGYREIVERLEGNQGGA